MSIQHEIKGDYFLIKMKMEYLDARASEMLKEQLSALIENTNLTRVVIDLSSVKFIDSSGFGTLIFCLNRCKALGKELSLCSLTEQANLCFRTLNLDKLFKIENKAPEK